MRYPTKEEIQGAVKEFKMYPPLRRGILRWKQLEYTRKWKKSPLIIKQEAIERLILEVLQFFNQFDVRVEWGSEWKYLPREHIIVGDPENISIISALHETGHAIFGASELLACVFSIRYFKACFPREASKLTWDGHMLKKPV